MNVFNYIDRDSIVHHMTGASKLAFLLLWTLAAMLTFNTPFLILLTVVGFLLFPLSKISPSDVKGLLIFLLGFMVLNNILIYLFSPQHGVSLYGTEHLLFQFTSHYTVTQEQLLYQANVMLKYTATIPLILVFVSSTNPSELAASLNRIGVSYKISYALALALRYIPDLVDEYRDVSRAQQARGIEMSDKENLINRIKSAAQIVMPLILSSVDRIDTITNAMELRKFGLHKKRTWVMGRKYEAVDIAAIVIGVLLMVYSIVFMIMNGGRYWNPFV